MPLICPRMRLILANSFFLFWMMWDMTSDDNIPRYGIVKPDKMKGAVHRNQISITSAPVAVSSLANPFED
jgi:hypothetical protein